MAGNKCCTHESSYRQAYQYIIVKFVFHHLRRGTRQNKYMAFPSGHTIAG
jgi:hypothetical protein